MNEELLCPYCGAIQQTHEPDEISALMCMTECEACGREFWYSVTVTREYDSRKGDEEERPSVIEAAKELAAVCGIDLNNIFKKGDADG